MKIEIEREVLHQLARKALGTRENGRPDSENQAVQRAAQRIADATAVPPA